MIAPTLTPGSPLARLGETALQWGHSMETLSGTPVEQIQRTARLAAWLAGQGVSPLIVSTPSAEHAVLLHRCVTENWMHPDMCWIASAPILTLAPARSMVVMTLRHGDLERLDTLSDGTEPHVTLTGSGILRVVLHHPILGPR